MAKKFTPAENFLTVTLDTDVGTSVLAHRNYYDASTSAKKTAKNNPGIDVAIFERREVFTGTVTVTSDAPQAAKAEPA